MVSALYFITLFAIAYAIKGGQLGHVIPHVKVLRERNKFYNRLFDGKVLSTLIVIIGCAFYMIQNQVNIGIMPYAWMSTLWIGAMWLLGVAPSMGEEYATIMNSKTNNPYQKYPEFGRAYGIKKGVQRGIWTAACMVMATGFIWFIPAFLAFVPLAWVAFNYAPNKGLDQWGWSEILIGAVCFGLPMGISVL